MKFKIGDKVLWEAFPSIEYEIIATKEQPYQGLNASPFHQPTKVPNGNDYLLKELNSKKTFIPFQPARESDLRLAPT